MTLKHSHPRAQNTHPLLSDPAAHLEEVCKNEGPRDRQGRKGAWFFPNARDCLYVYGSVELAESTSLQRVATAGRAQLYLGGSLPDLPRTLGAWLR